MLQEGRRIDAHTALDFGLVAEVVRPDLVVERAREVALQWASENRPRPTVRDGLVEQLTRVNEQESVMFGQALCGRAFLESMVRQAAETGRVDQAWSYWRLMMEGPLLAALSGLKEGGHFVEVCEPGMGCGSHIKKQRPDVQWHMTAVHNKCSRDPSWMQDRLQELGRRTDRADLIGWAPGSSFDLRQQATDAFKHLQTSASLSQPVVTIAPKMGPELDHQSSYVVTGGTGALGLLVGRWLVDRGAGHVVLLSRSGTPSSTKAWADLEAQQETRVVVKKCDVADQLAVRSILLEIHHRTAPVKGVMHAAGVLRDALLADQTDHAFDEVLYNAAR